MLEPSSDTGTVSACLIIIGNEILSGRTQDANLAYLAKRLNDWGIRLTEARVIPDVETTIVETLNAVRPKFDYVFTTGGIGPTHDDITADCVAKAFGVPLTENSEARAILENFYGLAKLNPARLRMARTPEGARLIENPISKAPGFEIGNVFVLAGIPKVMQAMVESLAERLRGGRPLLSRSLLVEMPESVAAPAALAVEQRFPTVEVGSYPAQKDGRFQVTLVLRSVDPAALEEALSDLAQSLTTLGASPREVSA